MKLIIDIPEGLKDVFEHRAETITALDVDEMRIVIKNGILIPKGHGRIIDCKELAVTPIDITDLPEKGCLMVYLAEDVDEAPTIIEADTGEENE